MNLNTLARRRPVHAFALTLLAVLGTFAMAPARAQTPPLANPALEKKVDDLLKQMTLEEKIGLCFFKERR